MRMIILDKEERWFSRLNLSGMESLWKIASLLFLFFLLAATAVYGQNKRNNTLLRVSIADEDGAPVPAIFVQIKDLDLTKKTDSDGRTEIPVPKDAKIHLSVFSLGYEALDTTLSVSGKEQAVSLSVKKDISELKSFQVIGQTHGNQLKLDPVKPQIINTLGSKDQPSTLAELMNRSSGLRIRQSGALGANADISLNGFQNRSIRYFKDGMPLEYLGAAFSVSLIPVNMLDHVEVYKGVLPVNLGADALGGAVNFVTRDHPETFTDVSYEIGSFDTHRVSLNTKWVSRSSKYFVGVNGFFNYSKGDYAVEVQNPDPETGVLKDIKTKLFHNQFSNYYVEAYGGIQNVKWADELRLILTGFDFHRQLQFGTTMYQPFGAARGIQNSVVPALQYKKSFADHKLDLTLFAEANTLHSRLVDTAYGSYNWLGDYTYNPAKIGEINQNGSLSKINFKYFTSRLNLRYRISGTQQLDLNAVIATSRRKGSDPLAKKLPDGSDYLGLPATYNKTALALGLTSDLWNKKVQNNLIVKLFGYHSSGYDLDIQNHVGKVNNNKIQGGIADGIKWQLSEKNRIQLSAETALRLPEQDELFGDGNLQLANFNLKPEHSFNLNVNFRRAEAGKYAFEVNGFYRNTRNMILLIPSYFFRSQSINLDDVRGVGVDLDAHYFIRSWLRVSGNLTYQDLRLIHTGNPTIEKSRLRNTPFFFSNWSLDANFHHLFRENDRLELNWYYSFVRQFYFNYIPKSVEPSGFLGLWGKAKINSQNVIPDQNLHTAGLTYYPAGERLAVGFQIKNVFNSRVFDNFKIQNPGRNFSLKVDYSFF